MKITVKGTEYENGRVTEEKYDILDEAMNAIDISDNRAKLTFSKEERNLMKETIIAYFDNQFTAEDLMVDRGVDDLIYMYIRLTTDVMERAGEKVDKYQKNLMKGKK